MTLTVIIGIASLLFIAASFTGVIVDRAGKPSVLIKSKSIRVFFGITGIGMVLISIFMWNKELSNSEGCKNCEADLLNVTIELSKLQERLNQSENFVSLATTQSYEDASGFLMRVAKLLGNTSKFGCEKSINHYETVKPKQVSDNDLCTKLKFLMHPVTIVAKNGIDEKKLQDRFSSFGLPSYSAAMEAATNARSDYLAIFYPDSVSKELICFVKNEFEIAFSESNPSATKQAIRYAMSLDRLAELQNNNVIMSSQAIQLGSDIRPFVEGLKEIEKGDWKDICAVAYSKKDFEFFIYDKSSGATLPKMKNES